MHVTLDGRRVAVAAAPAWKLTRGTAPYVLVLEMDRAEADDLFENSTRYGSVLVMSAEDRTMRVSGLSIIGTSPSSIPGTVKVSVADQRFWWPYRRVDRRYNVRRKSPFRRKTGGAPGFGDDPKNLPEDVLKNLVQIGDDVAYAQWSIRGGKTAWTAEDVIKDVIGKVVDPKSPGFAFDSSALKGSLPEVEGADINGQGDTVVSRALALSAGSLDVYVDTDGVAVVYQVQNGAEIAAAGIEDGSVRPVVGRPLSAMQDNSKVRPSKFEIFFERLIEARVNFSENGDLVTVTRADQDGAVPITAFNVFPMPEDGTMPPLADRGGRELLRGTWVTLSDLLAYYKANPKGNKLQESLPLSVKRIRELWLTNALNAYAHPAYDKGGLWARRMAVIRQHYRATYRINRPWLDRYKRIEPYRVGLEDPETGARAPAAVFQDYTVILAFPPSSGDNATPAEEVEWTLTNLRKAKFLADGSPSPAPPGSDIVNTPISEMNGAPATVSVVDSDLGIVHVTMASDMSGLTDRYLRSGTNELNQPLVYGQRSGLNKDGRLFLLQDEELSLDHEVSIVLTMAMGAPNGPARFYKIDVDPNDAERLLPGAEKFPSRPGDGPPLQIRVNAPRAVARHAWRDDRAQQLYEAFSNKELADIEAGEQAGEQIDIGEPVNIEQLTAYAQGVAAKEAARYRDHPEGGLTTTFNPGAEIVGTVSSVTHEFSDGEDGGALTTLELLPEPPALDVAATLPKDVRRVIEGFVDNPR